MSHVRNATRVKLVKNDQEEGGYFTGATAGQNATTHSGHVQLEKNAPSAVRFWLKSEKERSVQTKNAGEFNHLYPEIDAPELDN